MTDHFFFILYFIQLGLLKLVHVSLLLLIQLTLSDCVLLFFLYWKTSACLWYKKPNTYIFVKQLIYMMNEDSDFVISIQCKFKSLRSMTLSLKCLHLWSFVYYFGCFTCKTNAFIMFMQFFCHFDPNTCLL